MTKQQKWKRRLVAEIDALREGNEGRLDPAALVAWAENNPKSALYESFEWDNDKAGYQYRLSQARHIIHEYDVEYIPAAGSERKSFISVPILRPNQGEKRTGGSYVPKSVVRTEETYRQSVLDEVTKTLQATKAKYSDLLPELLMVWEAIPD